MTLPFDPDQLTAPYVLTAPMRDRLAYKRRQLSRPYLRETVRARLRVAQDREQLEQLRAGRAVVWAPVNDPLVTVRIATYAAGEKLRRAVDSALAQTYARTEVLVVGDRCDEATVHVAQSYGDRIRFVQLGHRGQYPPARRDRWMVAGATPMNAALKLAHGAWIAPCDDDDVLTPDHVEKLLAAALAEEAELVWSRAAMQLDDGSWSVTTGPELRYGQVSHGSVLYSTELRFMEYNLRCYHRQLPADWELFSRMRDAGVRIAHLPDVTYIHYASTTA